PRARWARATLDLLADAKRNRSGIKPEDLRSRLEEMAGRKEPELFDDTPPEPLLTNGPAITFVSPTGTAKGPVDIKVTAASPVGVKSLTVAFQMPGAPVLVDENPAPDVFEVHGFDTTALAEGDWILVAHGEDSLANPSEATGTFTVDNIGSGTV